MNLFNRIKTAILAKIPSRLRNKRIFFFGLIALALPVTIFLTQQIQDTRQRASGFPVTPPEPTIGTPSATVMPSSPPSCKTGLSAVQFNTYCGDSSFRNVVYTCQDGYGSTLGSSTSCSSTATLAKLAQDACAGHSSCSTFPTNVPYTPAPTKIIYPTYVPTTAPTAIATPTSVATPTPVKQGLVNASTTPEPQTIKILTDSGTVVAQTSNGKLSQSINPGKYYVSFKYNSFFTRYKNTPKTTQFTVESGKTTTIVGDFRFGSVAISIR